MVTNIDLPILNDELQQEIQNGIQKHHKHRKTLKEIEDKICYKIDAPRHSDSSHSQNGKTSRVTLVHKRLDDVVDMQETFMKGYKKLDHQVTRVMRGQAGVHEHFYDGLWRKLTANGVVCHFAYADEE